MHPGTEDLLSIRDGEPVDAEARAAVDADPTLRAEVARLRATRERLRELPELAPPAGVREKVFAELSQGRATRRATSPEPRRAVPASVTRAATGRPAPVETSGAGPRLRLLAHGQWPLRGAIAAAVALVALLGVRALDEPAAPAPGTIVAGNPVSTADTAGFGAAGATYALLTSESARLERLLNEIPVRPRLVNAGTATTISGLEDLIGQVDEVLMYANANGLRPEQAEALWQQRVDLMNALVEVRYAEAQRFGF